MGKSIAFGALLLESVLKPSRYVVRLNSSLYCANRSSHRAKQHASMRIASYMIRQRRVPGAPICYGAGIAANTLVVTLAM